MFFHSFKDDVGVSSASDAFFITSDRRGGQIRGLSVFRRMLRAFGVPTA
jgi:hypothetical protein